MKKLNIHDNHLGKIKAHSGAIIDFFEPENSEILIEDIAHGLAHICRFGGQCYNFYSVAQHSLLVTALCPPSLKKTALLHDAQEAFLGDVVTPLKMIFGSAYKDLENRFQSVIANIFDVDTSAFIEIKTFDKLALEIEARALKENNPESIIKAMKKIAPDIDFPFWNPNQSKFQYLKYWGKYK